MRRSAAVPFGLPVPRGTAPILWSPQAAILSVGLLLVPLIIFALLAPWLVQMLAREEVLSHRQTFGFDVGELRDAHGGTHWGFTAITPGGTADRAGLRNGDAIPDTHGSAGSMLLAALKNAAAGRDGCFEVRNLQEPRPLDGGLRTVCLGRPQTSHP